MLMCPDAGAQVVVNEEVDPALVIRRLKQEIRDLKDEIRSARCMFGNQCQSQPCMIVSITSKPVQKQFPLHFHLSTCEATVVLRLFQLASFSGGHQQPAFCGCDDPIFAQQVSSQETGISVL